MTHEIHSFELKKALIYIYTSIDGSMDRSSYPPSIHIWWENSKLIIVITLEKMNYSYKQKTIDGDSDGERKFWHNFEIYICILLQTGSSTGF